MRVFYTVAACMLGLAVSLTANAYPEADAFLGEDLFPAEAYYADMIERTVAQTLTPRRALRDAHPKAHGCVAASFEVYRDLPATLAHGVFQPGQRYAALVRFSNGASDPQRDDAEGDTRGMALKLQGVAGAKLLHEAGEESSQDFILISSPQFFVNAPADYAAFFQALEGEWWQRMAIPYYLGWRGSLNAWQMLRTQIANPLDTRYWSVVPYQLGVGDARQAVKYSARPCTALHAQVPANAGPNYLRAAMRQTLQQGPACMEFMLQRKSAAMSVEDVVTRWDEQDAPFVPVARLLIPQQQFDTPANHQQCTAMRFNPWHALAAHKPLGAISRIRRQVYQGISAQRLAINPAAP